MNSGYNHHIGDGVQQLSELTNGGAGTASGPPSGSGAGSGDENGYVPQGYDPDQDYHSISDNTHPGYVENSPEFYSPSLLDKAFNPQTTFSINKSFSRSKYKKSFGYTKKEFKETEPEIIIVHNTRK